MGVPLCYHSMISAVKKKFGNRRFWFHLLPQLFHMNPNLNQDFSFVFWSFEIVVTHPMESGCLSWGSIFNFIAQCAGSTYKVIRSPDLCCLRVSYLLDHPRWTYARKSLLSSQNSTRAHWFNQLLAPFPQRSRLSQQWRWQSVNNLGDFNGNNSPSDHHHQPRIFDGMGSSLQDETILRVREWENLLHWSLSGSLPTSQNFSTSDRYYLQGPDHEVLTGTVAPVYALDLDVVTGYLAIGIGSEVHVAQEISGSENAHNLLAH